MLLGFAVSMWGQLNRGSITGTITDSSGAAVPGASVSARHEANNSVTETKTNEAGQYNFPNLLTGSYSITVESPNFKKSERKAVELGVSQVQRVDLSLEVGSVAETVTVSAEVSRVQTDSPEVGTSLNNDQMKDLPLSISGARLVENFAYAVTPGVSGNSWTSNINGSTSFSKETLLDGATVTTYLSGHFGESSVSMESLQEFRIQTSGMSAEFGRAQAGVFNYVMKSGTNEIHGSAYGMLRNEALNANTFANNARGVPRAPDRHHNYAFSFGAPITIPKIYSGRDKTFFYTSYEKYQQRIGGFGNPNITHPLPEFLDGDFSRLLGPALPQTDALGRPVLRGAIYDPQTFRQLDNGRWIGEMFPNNRIPVSRFSPVSRNLVNLIRQGYLPNVVNSDGTVPLVNNAVRPVAGTPRFDQYQFATKVDQLIGSNHRTSASYSLTRRPRLLLDQTRAWDPSKEDGGPLGSARNQVIFSQLARTAWDWNVAPTMLNNLTVYYNRMSNPNIGSYVGVNGAEELGIRNLSTFGYPNIVYQTGPFVSLTQMGDPQNDFQTYIGMGLLNTFSFSKGRHFMKAGIDLRRNHQNQRPTQGGTFNFNPLQTSIPGEVFSGSQTGFAFASMLLGQVHSGSLSDPVGVGGRRNYYAAFFQDDFKVNARLTLNLGLRWEYQPPFYEVADRYASWSPDERDPLSGLMGAYQFAGDCDVCTGSRYFGNPQRFRDWGPRIGFAFRALPKLTLRGAYGIMYEGDLFNGFGGTPLGGATRIQASGVWDLSADAVEPWRGIFNWSDGFPTNRFIPRSYDRSYASRNRPGMIHPDYGKSPYTQQWNFNVQTEVAPNTIVDIGYVGNKATGLRYAQGFLLNQLDPKYLTEFGRNLNNPVRNPAEAAANGIAYPFPGFQGTVASALRPYPQIQGTQTVNVYGAPVGFSTYHSLQLTVNRQFSKGFQIYANYTWSKNLTNMQSSLEGDNGGRPLDYYNLALEKAVANDDQPHLVKVFFSWDTPIGRGRAIGGGMPTWLSAVIGSWQVSGILNYYSGTPLSITTSTSPLAGVWNGVALRANIVSPDMKNESFQRGDFNFGNTADPMNTYLNKAAFADPAPLTLGNAAPYLSQVRNFGTISENLSLQKVVRFGEKFRFQLRGDFLNAFNRPQWGGLQTNVTNPLFGQITSVSGQRSIQLGTRLDF
jgi:hypothetical protein